MGDMWLRKGYAIPLISTSSLNPYTFLFILSVSFLEDYDYVNDNNDNVSNFFLFKKNVYEKILFYIHFCILMLGIRSP